MFSHLLLLSILAPLAAAVVVAAGLPTRIAKVVAGLGFAVPALIALHVWYHFPADLGDGYAFKALYNTGLQNLGIKLHLGLNGIALPLFILAGIVGLAAGLYAIQSGAERIKTYLALLLVMVGINAALNVYRISMRDAVQLSFRIVMVLMFGLTWSNFTQIYVAASNGLSALALEYFRLGGSGIGFAHDPVCSPRWAGKSTCAGSD